MHLIRVLSANNALFSDKSAKRRRDWAKPISVNEQRNCCKHLSCVERFRREDTSYLARTLSKEQAIMRRCSKRSDRKRFTCSTGARCWQRESLRLKPRKEMAVSSESRPIATSESKARRTRRRKCGVGTERRCVLSFCRLE